MTPIALTDVEDKTFVLNLDTLCTFTYVDPMDHPKASLGTLKLAIITLVDGSYRILGPNSTMRVHDYLATRQVE